MIQVICPVVTVCRGVPSLVCNLTEAVVEAWVENCLLSLSSFVESDWLVG